MPRRPDVPCAICGTMMWRGTGSKPAGQMICRPCRQSHPQRTDRRSPCTGCGEPSWGQRCKSCAGIAQRTANYDPSGNKVRRRDRERSAPGMRPSDRKALLRKWVARGAACIYCGELATTIDHVVPLVRGGTNYEGNLAPCCRRCNGSKSGLMVAEWVTGRRCGQAGPLPWAFRGPRPKQKAAPISKRCAHCGQEYSGRKRTYCSGECLTDAGRLRVRNQYRERVGIPLDQPVRRYAPVMKAWSHVA